MGVTLVKYHTYQDRHHTPISEEQSYQSIIDILKQNSRKELIKMLSDAAMHINNGDNTDRILKYQQKALGIDAEVFLCHTRAILTLFQFVLENKSFASTPTNLSIHDVVELFLLGNSYYEFKNEKGLEDAPEAFFYSFRDIHNSFTEYDSNFYYSFYKRIHKRLMVSTKLNEFNKILQNRIGIDINTYSNLLSDITDQKNSSQLWELLSTHFAVSYDLLDSEWDNRLFKLPIPFNYYFFLKYPVILVDGNKYITSVNTLMYSIFTLLYRELNENDPNLFKNEFGGNIAEPEMIELLKEAFISKESVELNTKRGGKFEYADFAFTNGNDIYFFEIKTSILNDKNRYVDKEKYFYKNFDEKYVNNEGVSQQLNRLNDLSVGFDDFIERNKNALNKDTRYNIYPILFVFDESFQAFECNNYIKRKFKGLQEEKKFKFNSFDLGCLGTVVTINEVQYLNFKFSNTITRIELLRNFTTRVIDGVSFNIFLNKQADYQVESI